MVIVAEQQQADRGFSINSSLCIFNSPPAGRVVVIRVCFDSHILQLTELINRVESVCGWNVKWPIPVLCTANLFQAFCNSHLQATQTDLSDKSKIKDMTRQASNLENAWRFRIEVASVFILFQHINVAILCPPQNQYWEGLISFCGTLVEEPWEIPFISALSRLGSLCL